MHRAAAQLKIAGLLVIDRHAHDVGGQQIGRELQPAEVATEREGERAHERGLAAAGQIVEEDMAAGEDGHEDQFDLAVLADDDFLGLCLETSGILSERIHKVPLSGSALPA